jgi:hypothetical protein
MTSGHLPERCVALPGGWLVGDAPTDSRRYGTALIRPLTGREEEWLAQYRDAPNALAASRILDACVLRLDDEEPPRGLARRLLLGDRDYLILQLRRLMLGDRIHAIVACPACVAKMDVELDAAAIPIETPADVGVTHEIELSAAADGPDRSVRFRLPTGADQEAVLGMEIDTGAEQLLERCLLGGSDPPLSTDEKAAVIDAMEARAPRMEVELELVCPECSRAFVTPFDTTAFFLEEIRITASQLLREVHALALHYHWNEAEILSLTRERRRSYLSLLSDTLRRE